MKLALTWFGIVLTIATLGATSCSISHKSGDYACTDQSQCAPDRVCSQGFCLVPTGTGPDAPVSRIDAFGRPDATQADCPPGCSSCDAGNHVCNIACNTPGAANCGQMITCPAGWSCEIECSNSQNCRSGINCTDATACHVVCSGASSCRDITCGSGPCNVECSGFNSCIRNVLCGNSCRCDVSCTGNGTETCAGTSCGQACDDGNGGCTSNPIGVCSSLCQ